MMQSKVTSLVFFVFDVDKNRFLLEKQGNKDSRKRKAKEAFRQRSKSWSLVINANGSTELECELESIAGGGLREGVPRLMGPRFFPGLNLSQESALVERGIVRHRRDDTIDPLLPTWQVK